MLKSSLLFLLVAFCWTITASMLLADEMDQPMKVLLSQRCLDCHYGEEAEAAMDLDELLRETDGRQRAAAG